MKKLLALLLAAMMIFSLAACGNNDDNPSGNENNPGVSQSGENNDNKGGEEGFAWPDNVGSVPNPEWGEPFHYGFSEAGARVHTMFYNGVTQEQAKAYAEKLTSDHGFEFSYDPDESDGYFASLTDGTYKVTVKWTTENLRMEITIPD